MKTNTSVSLSKSFLHKKERNITKFPKTMYFKFKKHGRHIAYAPVFYVFLTLSDVRLKPHKKYYKRQDILYIYPKAFRKAHSLFTRVDLIDKVAPAPAVLVIGTKQYIEQRAERQNIIRRLPLKKRRIS